MGRCKVMLLIFIVALVRVSCANKYSEEANKPAWLNDGPDVNFREVEKPFRMAKLNLLWSKAQRRLTEPKLRSLYSELKMQDKEEIMYKRIKSDGLDKEGFKEAELRKKLRNTMDLYGLLEHFEEVSSGGPVKQHKAFNEATEEYINKSLFKDKKLLKLWQKAETAGFSSVELKALEEEFQHHQEKIDEYHSLYGEIKKREQEEGKNDIENDLNKITNFEEMEETDKELQDKVNLLRDHHQNLRDGYDRLHRIAAKGPNSREFVEPKVEGLWKLALEAGFSPEELESIRVELGHYENRLLKLRHLQAEKLAGQKKRADLHGEKSLGMEMLDEKIKHSERKVMKLHSALESRITQNHVEL